MALKSLAKKLEELQAKKGYCCLLPKHYATISAKRTCCSTGVEVDEQQPYIIEKYPGTNEMAFRLLEGPTGCEAWNIYQCLLKYPTADWWAACAGTPGRWDRLMVNGAEILGILEECGYV